MIVLIGWVLSNFNYKESACAYLCNMQCQIYYTYMYNMYVYVCACMNSFNTWRTYLEVPADFCILIQGIHWGARLAHWQFSDDT